MNTLEEEQAYLNSIINDEPLIPFKANSTKKVIGYVVYAIWLNNTTLMHIGTTSNFTKRKLQYTNNISKGKKFSKLEKGDELRIQIINVYQRSHDMHSAYHKLINKHTKNKHSEGCQKEEQIEAVDYKKVLLFRKV